MSEACELTTELLHDDLRCGAAASRCVRMNVTALRRTERRFCHLECFIHLVAERARGRQDAFEFRRHRRLKRRPMTREETVRGDRARTLVNANVESVEVTRANDCFDVAHRQAEEA